MSEPILDQQQRKRLDRQRFIGIQTQKRLLKFRVLITPANGINTQLAKNLILSGVNVTIYDSDIVDELQFQSNFLISKSDIGRKRGESIIQKLKQMNPSGKNVWVDEDMKDFEKFDNQEIFKQFTIIVTSQTNFEKVKKWDEISKKLNVPYYNQVCCGLYAFSYISLGQNYQYKEINKKDKNVEKIWNINSLTLEQCLKVENLTKSKESNFLTAIMMIHKAQQQSLKYDPFLQESSQNHQQYSQNQQTLIKIVNLGLSIRQQNKKNTQFYKRFATCYGINYCPVYSIIGSIISQEIIKIAENQYEPGINWLVYDSQEGFGSVFKLKSQQGFIKMRKPNQSVNQEESQAKESNNIETEILL